MTMSLCAYHPNALTITRYSLNGLIGMILDVGMINQMARTLPLYIL